MTLITLDERATEQGTFGVTVTFTDDTGAEVIPTSATWTLTDGIGTVVHSRSAVVISALAATKTIVLAGDDLALSSSYFGSERYLLVNFVYSSTLGSGLVGRAEIKFVVDDYKAVT